MKPHRSIFIMYQWQLINPYSSMNSYQGKYILYYINHQSINLLTSINHLTSINQTIAINDNMIQQSPPLALMVVPTLMSTPNQLLMSTCRYGILYINSQCDHPSPSIKINHINVINSPPLTSIEKVHSPLGVAPLAWTFLGDDPLVWVPLIFLWILLGPHIVPFLPILFAIVIPFTTCI